MTDSPTYTRWLIVALIFCLGVLMFIDRVNISMWQSQPTKPLIWWSKRR